MDSTIMVPRTDTFAVPLLVKVQTFSAVSRILQGISDTTVAFKVDGKVKMGKGGVFLSYPVHFEGVQKTKDLGKLFSM